MATPLKKGSNICIVHERYPADFEMPTMDIATDHYNIGFTIKGDRKVITQSGARSYHAGDVSTMPPYVYHRTTFLSDVCYEKIMIKYSPDFAEPFIGAVGQNVFDYLNETGVFHFTKDIQEKIYQMFSEMLEVYRAGRAYSEFILQGMLFRLLTFVYEKHLTDTNDEIECVNMSLPVMTAVTYIETFYYRNPSIKEVSSVANLSEGYFSRLFHKQLGQSYSSYLNRVKLKRAAYLLVNTKKTIMGIALETGFCHGNYFSEQFKKTYGISPKDYRKKG